MNNSVSSCFGCLWSDSCDSDVRCGDYTPVDQSDDILYYQNVLKENHEEYQSFVDEFHS